MWNLEKMDEPPKVSDKHGDILAFSPKGTELNLVPSYDKFVFSQDGSNLAAGDRQGRIHLWDTTMSKKLATLTGHRDSKESEILALAFSHDNRLLASGGEDKKVMLWDTQNMITVCLQVEVKIKR